MDAEGSVDPGAVDADEDPIRDGGPRGVLRPAVEANLEQKNIGHRLRKGFNRFDKSCFALCDI